MERGWKMRGKRCIIAVPHTRRGRVTLGLGLFWAAVVVALLLWPRHDALPQASVALREAAQGLNTYTVALRLNAQERTLAINESLKYRNDTGAPLTSLVLRTWINAYQREETSPAAVEELYDDCYPTGFSPGSLTLYDILWNGETAAYAYLDGAQTALEIQIPLLPAEGEGKLELRCVAVIPECAHRTGLADGVFQLGNVIPLLSRYEEGAWRTDDYCPIGEPFVSDCANFSITLHAPEGYVPACSAPLVRGTDGAWRGELFAARDVALCVSRDYCLATGRVGDTQVYSYAKTEAGAGRALVYARKALETFSALYGVYPYPAFTVCCVDFPFGGMEYPGLCMIGKSYYLDSMADSLELVVVHETAHQWFYALVGSDSFYQPWQDEALCEYATLAYARRRYGQGSYDTLKYYRVDAPMRENIPGGLTPGSPIDYFGTLNDYSAVVYGRGAALLIALDELLPQGVDPFLRAYAEKYAFSYATRAEFEAFLNEYAGMDLSPLLLDYLDTALSALATKERVLV